MDKNKNNDVFPAGTYVVVPGYGCHLVPELSCYLDRVIAFINTNKPDYIIFCGGFTQRKSAPGVSEAKLMAEYVMPKLEWGPVYFLEEASYTTLENIKNVKMYMPNKYSFLYTINAIFCEATRALKVDMLAKYYFSHRVNIETASWELQTAWKEIADTIKTFFAMRFPPLAAFLRWKRLRRAERI